MSTHRRTWKRFEQRVATFFGSRRAPLSGSNGAQTGSDTLHKQLFIECKLRAKSPVHCLFAQVEKSAAKEGKTPVVALQQKHCPGFLVVCRPEHLHVLASYAKDIDRLPESDP